MVKESFRDIYATAKTYSEALKMFDAWINAIPPLARFDTMKETFIKRKTHILNYWSYRWTNAFTESTNNAIKKIEKAGRGYKFDVLRDRCILSINNPAPDKFKYKNAVYVKKDIKATFKEKQESLYDIAFSFEDALSSIPIREYGTKESSDTSFTPTERSRMVDFLQRIACTNRGKDAL